MHRYSRRYFAHFDGGSARAAELVLPMVTSLADVTSVADFGCGTGTWLAAWQRLGVTDVAGCDGPHLKRSWLLFDPARFAVADLARPVRLGRRFDLAQSLEVAEHLPPAAAMTFVETLVSHAPIVLFSAAVPGQGGEHHVNEQPLEYWRALFRQRGFRPLDALRPRLAGETEVAPWYRYNVLLFVDDASAARLDSDVRGWLVPDGAPLRDYAPLAVRSRNRLLKHVPEPVVTAVAAALRRVMGVRPGSG
jgi:SAM-dependent methyltransferase